MEWIVVIIIRLCVPLLIFRWQLAGTVLAIVADNLDVVILDYLGVKDYSPYNRVDKFLDTYLYSIQGYTVFYWENFRARRIGLALLVYRVVGVILYEILNARILLFIFPNVFLWFYLFYLIYKKVSKDEPFTKTSSTLFILVILTVFKLIHEYVLHVVQLPIYQVIREQILSKIFL